MRAKVLVTNQLGVQLEYNNINNNLINIYQVSESQFPSKCLLTAIFDKY